MLAALEIRTDPIRDFLQSSELRPLFLVGDALSKLREIPDDTIDFCMTSPPYWGKRKYASEGIGLEEFYQDFVQNLLQITDEIKRVLKPTGSFWLNIGDTYLNKTLLGIPWRVAIAMIDNQKWVLRNEVIWNKVKGGPDNSLDKLGNVHEQLFHFVKNPKGYFYDAKAIRANPRQTTVKNGAVISGTGVTGVRYKRQIELSTSLSIAEKEKAFAALNAMIEDMRAGRISDFRMIIRGQQRATHSNETQVSGRAKELQNNGFYFLKYHPDGAKPRDVWDIIPEDTQNRELHYAAYPADLCKIPILCTCPEDGIVLDPFCGTGTTNLVALQLRRRSIGIDLSSSYINVAEERCQSLF